jgi:hypothetical protein
MIQPMQWTYSRVCNYSSFEQIPRSRTLQASRRMATLVGTRIDQPYIWQA